jgi:hypothetical protein
VVCFGLLPGLQKSLPWSYGEGRACTSDSSNVDCSLDDLKGHNVVAEVKRSKQCDCRLSDILLAL